jgi:hypothetical protein
MDCYLRRESPTKLHYALIADGGLRLAEGTVPRATAPTFHPDIATHIAALERLLSEGYQIGPPAQSEWRGHVRHHAGRWYGGDPVLLRYVEGNDAGWPLTMSDYRMTPVGLMAHQVYADGPWGATITLRLDVQ